MDIEDDLLGQLRELAHRSGAPMKKVLNTALRRGIESMGRARRKRKRYSCPVFAMGRPSETVDLDRALAAADALEDGAVQQKLKLRK